MSVQFKHLSLYNFHGCTLSCAAARTNCDAIVQQARHLLGCLLSGRTIPAYHAEHLRCAESEPKLLAEFRLQPWQDEPLAYDVRYEAILTVEKSERAQAMGRSPQPYCRGERLTYVEDRGGSRTSWRKAYDTVGLKRFEGIRPKDILWAIGRNRAERAKIAAVRLLAEGLGRSFLFLDEFQPLARQAGSQRPGSYFLWALRNFAGQELA